MSDIKDIFSYKRVGNLDLSKIRDDRKIASRICNGVLLAAAVLRFAPIPIPQVKIPALVLGAVLTTIGMIPKIFENKEKKIQERQTQIREILYKNIDDNISNIQKEMFEILQNDILGQLRSAINLLNSISSDLKLLASSQRIVAMKLNRILLDANKDLILEAIRGLKRDDSNHNMISAVARIPGEYMMVSLIDQEYVFDYKVVLEKLFQEKIFVLYDSVKINWLSYESVIGEKIKIECIKYNDFGDAIIVQNDDVLKPNVIKRIDLAQQLFSEIVIMERY